MPEKNPNEESIELLRDRFSMAHGRYVGADIDRTFRKQALFPLREALNQFEKIEQGRYSSETKSACELLLLRLRSVNLLIEGFYWIGSYDDAKSELGRFKDLEQFFNTVTGKTHNDILLGMSRLATLREAAPLLINLASVKNGLVNEKNRIIQELIRSALNMAVVFYYVPHKYEPASILLENCRTLALTTKTEDGVAPYRLLAQIDYFTACAMRQDNRLSAADVKLREVLDHYLDQTDWKRKRYLKSNKDAESCAAFERTARMARYRAALTLMARSDLNRRFGNLSIALYANLAVARIILAETNDTINLAYARMLFAIISREMYANEEEILRALEMIGESQHDFQEMDHQKYLNRSTFERAYTLYYLARLYSRSDTPENKKKAKERIKEATVILERLQVGSPPRRKAQYLTLEGRLLIVRGDNDSIERGRLRISEAIEILSKTVRHNAYLVEARIAMSRVLMEQYVRDPSRPIELLNDAEKFLLQAQRENMNADGEPENNKIEAIIDFALARVKVQQGFRDEAEARLKAGLARLPVIDSDGVRRLYEFAQRELTNRPFIYHVSNDLDMKDNVEALRQLIVKQAINEVKIRDQKAWEIVGLSPSQFYAIKNRNSANNQNRDSVKTRTRQGGKVRAKT
jgi:hypothetical protein